MRTFRPLVALVAVIAVTGVFESAAQADDGHSWTSLYAGSPYAGSGWSSCAEPIRVSVDTKKLKSGVRDKVKSALKAAISSWNQSGLVTFQSAGELPATFDRATGVVRPSDGQVRNRFIYLTFVDAKEGSKTDPNVVGLAAPLQIDPATQTITEGSAAFRAKYVNSASKAELHALFEHELGHVFGLGHSTSSKDIMYATLDGQTELGPGDRAGIQAVTRPCPAAGESAR